MRALLMTASVFLLLACTPPYGQQTCKAAADCASGQQCPTLCALPDGGTRTEAQSICRKPCTADGDCGDLGLAKPACGVDACSGSRICIDNPF